MFDYIIAELSRKQNLLNAASMYPVSITLQVLQPSFFHQPTHVHTNIHRKRNTHNLNSKLNLRSDPASHRSSS